MNKWKWLIFMLVLGAGLLLVAYGMAVALGPRM